MGHPDIDTQAIEQIFGMSVMDVLSSALRGVIIARPGHQLYVADFASIEARVLFWLADDQGGLDVFRRHEDIYSDMATTIYRRKIDRKNGDENEGQLGKAAILGLGYQMGPSKFVATAATYGITLIEDLCCEDIDPDVSPWACRLPTRKHRREDHAFLTSTPDAITAVSVVDAYRAKYWRVVNMWADQENAALAAVLYDDSVECGKVRWFVEDRFLYCELPSGRRLAYPEPEVHKRATAWGEMKDTLTFMGVGMYSRKYERQSTYGGKIVENQDQAISRDLMADSLLRMERSGLYVPVLSVHDEAITEALLGTGNVKEFEQMMAETPAWGRGIPVEAEGWAGTRYRK